VMTTLDVVPKKKPEPSAEETAAKDLVRMAREQGLSLTGPDGLLKQFTKSVLETALNEEMTEHLGHEKPPRPRRAGLDECAERDPAEDSPDGGHVAGVGKSSTNDKVICRSTEENNRTGAGW
jgi:hypothetical protein